MKKSLIFVFLILSAFCIVTIFCKANYIIAKFTDICTYDNSQDIILVGHDSRKITSVDYIESKSNTGDLNAFEGIGALFSGLAFLAAFYTLTQQSKNIELAEENNKNNIRYQEYNSISNSIGLLQLALQHLNERYNNNSERADYDARDSNLAGCFSTKIYHDLAKDFKEFKTDFNEANTEEQKTKLKNRIRNQINYHTQAFLQVIYSVRGIFSRIDNSRVLTNAEKVTLGHTLGTSISHVDNKVLQLVYLRESFKKDFGIADTYNHFFSDDIAKLVIQQTTETPSGIADEFIYEALKAADPTPQDF